MVPIIALLGLIATICNCSASPEPGHILIYYIPFDTETYTPVTMSDVEQRAHFRLVVSDAKTKKGLINRMKVDPRARFDSQKVRAKIISPDKEYYVDSFGVAIQGSEKFTTNASDLNKVLDHLVRKNKTKSGRNEH